MTASSDFLQPLVIDNGTGMIKSGLANAQYPSSVFPSVVGRPKHKRAAHISANHTLIGDAALFKRGVMNLSYPIAHGIVTKWDEMEQIWRYVFEMEHRLESKYHPVLLTEAPLNPRSNREKMAEIMFESFGVPALYVAVQAVLSLYASAKTTAVVMDAGDGVSHVVPVYEGYSLPHATKRLNLAGRDVTEYLNRSLAVHGVFMESSTEKDIVRQIKEDLCYVSANPEEERIDEAKLYVLPDGNSISIKEELFRAPEILFQPSMIGLEHGGIPDAIFDSVTKCDIDIRKEMLGNVVLSGGTTMFPGFPERVAQDLKALSAHTSHASVNVLAPEDRKVSVWRGGSTLASLSTFQKMWITKAEFEEVGASVVHRKCF